MSEQDNSQLEGNEPVITDEELEAILNEPEPKEDDSARKDAIIRQLTARAKKAEALAKNFDNIKKQEVKPVLDDNIVKTVQSLELAERKRQFGYENNLSPAETDYLFKINQSPTKDLLEDPFVKGGIDAIRKQKRVEDNTPSSTSRTPRFELPKKDELTSDDKQNAFEDFMSKRLKK
jgi:hypothetical protein